MAKLTKQENQKLIAKEWSYVKNKKEVIAKHGEKGQARVNKAINNVLVAKKQDPFILYDLGFEKLNTDIIKSVAEVQSNKKKYSKDVIKRSEEIQNIIRQSNSSEGDGESDKRVPTVSISDNALLNTYICYRYPIGGNKKAERKYRIAAARTLSLAGLFVSGKYLERVLRIRPKESEKVIDALVKLKIIYKKNPHEVLSKPISKATIHNITKHLKPIVANDNSIKALIADFDRFMRIKNQFQIIDRIVRNLKGGKTKRPRCIFYFRLRKWKTQKKSKYNSSLKFVEVLSVYKGIFNNSSMLKGIDLSLAKPFIDNIEFEHVDLSGANLSGINFENCRFSKSFFIGTNFQGALVEKVDILRCNLLGSNWQESSFTKCNFSNSHFNKASLKDSQFFLRNRFQFAAFKNADLRNVNFVANTHFEKLDFEEANLSGSSAKKCTFRQCNFNKAVAKQLYASGAFFQNCSFEKADLSESELDLSSLSGSNLKYANLSNGNYKNANFSQSDLSYSVVDNAEVNRADFLACNLYLARMRNTSFEKAINLVGTEYPHIVIGDVLDTKSIHRATVSKRLKDIESSKDEVHFGTIPLKTLESVVGSENVLNKILFLIKNDNGQISDTEVKYNFLKTRNLKKIQEILELNKASNKEKILSVLCDEPFMKKEGIKLKIWDIPEGKNEKPE
ncbi:MAG: pentapeptide repeat-containing protein [Desulfobacterales bacterium]|nr:pentapeptide repeat-containing protein [Desulfobacterales bacterium]MCP4159644.1 pentapeptide repeat-containing protein [Deltaproteobacteria bacterium]